MNILGIDVGGVIISREGDGGDTSFFSDNYFNTPPSAQVFEVLARVVPKFDRTVIISKCGKKVQQKTMTWMDFHGFYVKTGIPEDNFYFCKERPQKAGIAEDLGVTHYIDDRMDILNSMRGRVPNLYLFGSGYHNGIVTVGSWEEFERVLNIS